MTKGILVSCTFAICTEESAQYGDYAETGFEWENHEYSFKELIDLFNECSEASCSPLGEYANESVWMSAEPAQDYRTGEHVHYSYHYSRDNPPRMAKYWTKALNTWERQRKARQERFWRKYQQDKIKAVGEIAALSAIPESELASDLDKYVYNYRALELVRAVELDPLGYQLRLWHVETQNDGTLFAKERLAYRLSDKRGQIIFEGADYGCPPMHPIDSDGALVGLLGFLTLRKGDTDEEYFKDYTPAQLEWIEDADCQAISLFVHDFENPPDEEFEVYIKLLDID